ncbi:hypothetical protein NUU61_002753, partial [Penicillium alfredii]
MLASPHPRLQPSSASMSPKRACDSCTSRKVKCNGTWPCDTCRDANKRIPCTYLRPARKRGPKVRRQPRSSPDTVSRLVDQQKEQGDNVDSHGEGSFDRQSVESCFSQRIPKTILASVIRLYQQYSFSVWPVVSADAVLPNLEDIDPGKVGKDDENTACLITALCAATMAQLHLQPFMDGPRAVDSSIMAKACVQMRGNRDNHNEHLDLKSVLVSFFLHVYHAKVNQRNSAMMFIQEAIAGARVLRLDELSCQQGSISGFPPQDHTIANKELVFPLLWVSERGYALHLGLSPSYTDPVLLPELGNDSITDVHVQGLLDLVKLFTAFDRISVSRKARVGNASITDLIATEEALSSVLLTITEHISTRTADCHITREWMRTILWQEALSLGLLSSGSGTAVMTFGFPAQVSRDLLRALRHFSETDLLPLGRDQLLKCFEVANSLADTVLFTSATCHSGFELGPQDFLHALYQKLLPFLEQDSVLKSILRAKTAEILVMAPARLLTTELGYTGLRWPRPHAIDGENNNHYTETPALKALSWDDLEEGLLLPIANPNWILQP